MQAVNQQQGLTLGAQVLRKLFAIVRYFLRHLGLIESHSTSQDQHLQNKRHHNAELERGSNKAQSNPIMQRWLRERPQEEPWNSLGV